MTGRKNKLLVIRLLKVNNIHYIVVTKQHSRGISRLDSIGKIGQHCTYAFCRIDFKKLNKYLIEKNIMFTSAFAKIMGLDIKNNIKFRSLEKFKLKKDYEKILN